MSREEFRTRIAGRLWRVRFEPARIMGTDWGRCWLPAGRHPLIQVRRALRGRRALEVLLHECLHAARPDMSETAVDETASALALAAWKAGYRRPE